MLYDSSRAGNAAVSWFDAKWWSRRGAVRASAEGRGAALFIEADGRRLVLRHYRRGGLIAHLSTDRYLWRGEWLTRPFVEWQLMYHLARAGLPVPAPIGARYRRSGVTYTGDLITQRLIDGEPLSARLAQAVVPILHWIAIGRCLRRFHRDGICHADLNAHNVLLNDTEDVWLVDFDRGSLRRPGLWCDSNLVRLRRSIEKITDALPAERFSEADWAALLNGYFIVPPARSAT